MNPYCLPIERCIRKITEMLLLQCTLVDCPGLIHGKLGIAIFFFHYAHYTGNGLFEDYAIDLIDEMQSQLHNNSPADYETGLAGIGVGMDYLISNCFLSVENDFFGDLDKRMYRAVIYDTWQDLSFYDGLTGYGQYWMMRLRQQTSLKPAQKCISHIVTQIEEKFPDIPANEQYDVYCFLHGLHQQMSDFSLCSTLLKQCRKWNLPSSDISRCFPRLGDSSIAKIIRKYHCSRYFNIALQDKIDIAMNHISDLDMEKPPANMGLLTGYAGEGLLRLTMLHQTNLLWMNLL